MRVIVLEDEGLLRSALAASLRAYGISVVASTGRAGDCVRLADATRPDAIIVDIHLGNGPSGIDAAVAIRRVQPHVGVVVLTDFEDPRLAGSMASGVPTGAEYLVKSRIPNASHVARAVERSISRVARAPGTGPSAALAERNVLSDVQMDIWRLTALGMTNAQIADARGVSEKSVEHAITRLARALEIESHLNVRVVIARRYFEACGVTSASDLA